MQPFIQPVKTRAPRYQLSSTWFQSMPVARPVWIIAEHAQLREEAFGTRGKPATMPAFERPKSPRQLNAVQWRLTNRLKYLASKSHLAL
jgi:hypothetical protein